jgi:dihydroneopterin aldolase
MIYVIRLANCAFFARHGVFAEEESLGQRFFVDVALTVDAGDELGADRLEAVVDYGLAFEQIEQIVTGRRRRLIETLALDIARGLVDGFERVRRAEVTLRKPNAPVRGILDHVEVTVAWPG